MQEYTGNINPNGSIPGMQEYTGNINPNRNTPVIQEYTGIPGMEEYTGNINPNTTIPGMQEHAGHAIEFRRVLGRLGLMVDVEPNKNKRSLTKRKEA